MRTSDIKERIFSAVATQFSIEDWLVHMTGDGLDCKVISPDEIGTSEGKLKLVLQFEPNK